MNTENLTRKEILELIDSLGKEVIRYTSIGDFKSAERMKAEIDVIISKL